MEAWLRGEDAGAGAYDKLQAEVLGSRGLPRLPAPHSSVSCRYLHVALSGSSQMVQAFVKGL